MLHLLPPRLHIPILQGPAVLPPFRLVALAVPAYERVGEEDEPPELPPQNMEGLVEDSPVHDVRAGGTRHGSTVPVVPEIRPEGVREREEAGAVRLAPCHGELGFARFLLVVVAGRRIILKLAPLPGIRRLLPTARSNVFGSSPLLFPDPVIHPAVAVRT